jgi:ABC-2 type transport system permease protein
MALLRIELEKATRRMRTLVALVVAIGIPALVGLAEEARKNRPDRGGAMFRLARQSGVVLPGVALALMSTFFLVVIAAMFAGDTIAGEAAWGDLRYLLMRPIARGRLLAAKALVAYFYTWVMTIAVAAAGLAVGVAFFGWKPVLLPGFLGTIAPGTLLVHGFAATAYVAFGLSAVVAVGVFFSTLTDSPAGAIGAAVGVYIVSDILDAVDSLGVLRYGLPTHYSDTWETLFTRNAASHDLIAGVVVQAVWIVVFLTLAAWWFGRKDIAS